MSEDLVGHLDLIEDRAAEGLQPAFADGRDASMIAKSKAYYRLARYGLVTLFCLPIQLILRRITPPSVWERFCRWYHARAIQAMGIRIEEHGTRCDRKPTLYVANHNGYLDIEILGARILGTFVAMAQVAEWPLFGILSKLQDTVFINRQARSVAEQQGQMTERFDRNQSLIMFPEGTSYNATHTLPFRSSLFAVAKHRTNDEPLTVQPVSVTIAKLDGMPISRTMRSYFGWYGDSPIVSHITNAAGLGRITVVLEWHEPRTIDDFDGNRKKLAAYCENAINDGMARARSR